MTSSWKRTVITDNQVNTEPCRHPFGDESFFKVQDRRRGVLFGGFKTYPTVFNEKTHHSQSLVALAESTNMFSVTFTDWVYRLKSIETNKFKSGQVWAEMWKEVISMIVTSLMSIANVQIKCSALELDLQLNGKGRFSFIFQLTLSFSTFFFAYDLVNRIVKIFQLFRRLRFGVCEWQEADKPQAQRYNWLAKYVFSWIGLSVWILMALISGYFVILYGLAKIVMVNYCGGGWNIPFQDLFERDGHWTSGCVKHTSPRV